MDGIHDLGGRQGFGPIDVNEPEAAFHHPWEGRAWAIVRGCRHPDWTIDWWRHVRELIDPVDYLTRPYFDSWAQTQLAANATHVTRAAPARRNRAAARPAARSFLEAVMARA